MQIKKCLYINIFICLCTLSLNGKFSFKKITSFFGAKPFQEVIHKEYKLDPNQALLIDNTEGPITVKTGWKKNIVYLKATKHAKKEEELPLIEINDTRDPKALSIKTSLKKEKIKIAVDYELIVPANIRLKIATQKGDLNVKDIHGPVVAITHTGDIDISNIKGVTNTQILNKGTTYIQTVRNAVTATSKHGDIYIDGAYQSVKAFATKGKVHVASRQVPTTSSISLEASGQINLELPTTTSANILGQAANGTITSDHYITLKPHTTKLNTVAWDRYRREVNGVIGTGETPINLRSSYGNVKITKTVDA